MSFEDDGTHNYLILWPSNIFKKLANTDHISEQKTKGLPDESIKPPATSNCSPALNYINTNLRIKFDGSCFKQEKVTFIQKL